MQLLRMEETMGNKYLLDCTLRDGGYVNDWQFGHDNIINIFDRVIRSKVDFIEVGFLDERRPFDENRSIMPTTDCVKRIYGKLDRKKAMVVGMIDFGTCDIHNLQPCKDSWLDGIRVIFKKNKMHPAMEFCRQVKALGYKVFSQLVSVSSYSDDELREVVSLANDVKPYALSMVDTYGLLDPQSLSHIMHVIDTYLDPNIVLGFHAHNNFQLGYVNATTVLDSGLQRDILVDGTLYGMGKSAGNAPLELIALYMNEHYGKSYVVTEMQEAITSSILDFQKVSPWGYQLFYYIAASQKVHPNYVAYLMSKKTLSVTAINEILKKLPESEKLEKNTKLIERLYMEYQKNDCDDSEVLQNLSRSFGKRNILAIGPGPSVGIYATEINEYIKENNPVIISVNDIPKTIHPDFLFLTNNVRFLQAATKLTLAENKDISIIASSNLTKSERDFDYVINYSSVIDEKAEFPDNSMCMLIRTLVQCGCRAVALAGFDGYVSNRNNYNNEDREYDFVRKKGPSLNAYAKRFFLDMQGKIDVVFVTPSEYEEKSK